MLQEGSEDGEKGGASGGNGIIIPREGGKQVGAADLSEANLSRRRSPSSESLSDMRASIESPAGSRVGYWPSKGTKLASLKR